MEPFSKFHRMKIIEETEDIPMAMRNLFVGPINIQEAEDYEDLFNKQGTPYRLAFGWGMTDRVYKGKVKREKQEGYWLFVRPVNRNYDKIDSLGKDYFDEL